MRNLSGAAGRGGEGSLILPGPAVCVFPGQGAQRVGMGRELVAAFASARRVFEEAEDRLGMTIGRLCFEGPAEVLAQTEVAQPAILATSVAAHRVLEETCRLAPVAVAGHSLGEWSALVVAGALEVGDAVAAVRERGRLMQEAVPAGVGAMAALLGIEAVDAEGLCAEAAQGQTVSPANYNGAGQVVVAGHVAAVERVVSAAAARRIRAQRLAVSAPFHCALMAPAAERFRSTLKALRFARPRLAVVSSVTGAPLDHDADLSALLERQVTAPVRWEEAMRALGSLGARVGIEAGPGRTLTGLAKRIVPDLAFYPCGDPTGVAEVTRVLT